MKNEDQPKPKDKTKYEVMRLFASQNLNTNYQAELIPPHFGIAERHREALSVGPRSQEMKETCPCCGLKIQKDLLDINCDIKKLSFLGPGYPLFFEFMQYCMYIIITILFVSGLYSLISNAIGHSCKKDKNCEEDAVIAFSIGNSHDKDLLVKVQIFLNFFTILVIFCLLQFYRKSQRKTDVDCDVHDVAANDYAIFLHDIPIDYTPDREDEDYDEDLKEALEKGLFENGKKASIVNIVMCYNIDQIQSIQLDKKRLIKQKQTILKLRQKEQILQEKLEQQKQGYKIDQIQPLDDEQQNIAAENDKQKQDLQSGEQQKLKGKQSYSSILNDLEQQKDLQGNDKNLQSIDKNLEQQNVASTVAQNSINNNEKEKNQQEEQTKQSIVTAQKITAFEKFGKNIENQMVQKRLTKDQDVIKQIDSEIKDLQIKLLQLQKKFQDGKKKAFMQKHFIGRALVSFKTEQEKDDVLAIYKKKYNIVDLLSGQKEFKYHGNVLEFQEAPYPSDIYWENLKYTLQDQISLQTRTTIANICLICFCFLIYFGILAWQQSYPDQSTGQRNVAIFGAIIISLLNFMIIYIIQFFAKYEGHHTRTEFNISVTRKLSFALFINNALMMFVLQIYIIPQDDDKFKILFDSGGLVHNIYFVFISNIFIPILMIIINPAGLYQEYKKRKQLKKKGKDSCILTQQELNKLFEKTEFKLSIESARVITFMFSMSFYTPVLPFAAIFTLISVFSLYWIYKYVLLRQRQVTFSQGAKLSTALTDLIEYIVPIYSISYIIFFTMLIDNDELVYVFGSVGIIIGVLHAFLPMDQLNEKIFGEYNAEPNKETYQEALPTFRTTYAKQNPAINFLEKEVTYQQDTYIKTHDEQKQDEEANKQQQQNDDNLFQNLINEQQKNDQNINNNKQNNISIQEKVEQVNNNQQQQDADYGHMVRKSEDNVFQSLIQQGEQQNQIENDEDLEMKNKKKSQEN